MQLTESFPGVVKAEVMVVLLSNGNNINSPVTGVRLGSWKGKFSTPDDFNVPQDDLKGYM